MVRDTIMIQSLPVNIRCEDDLFPGLKDYFDSLCPGKHLSLLNPLEMVVAIQSSPPPLPPGASSVVKTPITHTYRRGSQYYFTSKDGSLVQFDSATRNCAAFIRPEIQNEMSTICSLVSGPLIETMKSAGRFYLHAAGLCHNGIGYLVSGDGGCGKTTSALNLVRSGFDYVSDDSLLMDARHGTIRVYPWYRDFHLSKDLCRRYSELADLMGEHQSEEDKVSVDVSQYFQGSYRQWIEPDVIIFPRIRSYPTSVVLSLGPTEMFTRLMKQIFLASDPVTAERQLESIKTLVRQTSGFELLGGRDLLEDPDTLVSLITRLPVRH